MLKTTKHSRLPAAAIAEDYRNGMGMVMLAKKYELTASRVYKFLCENKIGREQRTQKRDEQIVALLGQGKTYEEVAGKLGMSKPRIQQIAAAHGIKRGCGSRPSTNIKKAYVISGFEQGLSCVQLAVKYKIYPRSVYKYLKQAGVDIFAKKKKRAGR